MSQQNASECNRNTLLGYMRLKEVKKIVPFSSSTIWRKVKAGNFVAPVKLSERITAWNRAEVYAWLHRQEGLK